MSIENAHTPSVIVEAVGVAVRSSNVSLGAALEAAMSDAVNQCTDEGIPMSDTDTIRARMIAARDAVLAAHS